MFQPGKPIGRRRSHAGFGLDAQRWPHILPHRIKLSCRVRREQLDAWDLCAFRVASLNAPARAAAIQARNRALLPEGMLRMQALWFTARPGQNAVPEKVHPRLCD
jgi:hypothetical protein